MLVSGCLVTRDARRSHPCEEPTEQDVSAQDGAAANAAAVSSSIPLELEKLSEGHESHAHLAALPCPQLVLGAIALIPDGQQAMTQPNVPNISISCPGGAAASQLSPGVWWQRGLARATAGSRDLCLVATQRPWWQEKGGTWAGGGGKTGTTRVATRALDLG